MKKNLVLFFLLCMAIFYSAAQTYHTDDKEGLRMFLRQPSAKEGQINAQRLGLEISDTLNWQTSETWVTKIPGLLWDNSMPKRLTHIGNSYNWEGKVIAGTLNCSKWEDLKHIRVFGNFMSSLVINNNQNLTWLDCRGNQLTFIDVSKNYNLENLDCSENQITELNLSNNTLLTDLECGSNKLTHLDISNNLLLTYLHCNTNKLTSLDLSNLVHLQWLNCENNQIPALNVDNCSELLSLNCLRNNLTHLGVTKCPLLIELICNNNQLSTLDLSNNHNLEWLLCLGNKLTRLDLSNNLELALLWCPGNQLTTLDVSANQNLSVLYCFDNQIKKLNLEKNLKLGELRCSNNQLTTLELNNNSYFGWLECNYNQLLFSKIPKPKGYYPYAYSPQKTIHGGNIHYEAGIDLREEYNINGNITQFSWFDITNGIEQPVELGGENGLFSLTEDFENKHLRCKMTNAEFPLLSGDNILVYEVCIGECETNGIEENRIENIKVYPNPTTGQLRITNYELRIDNVEVFDILLNKHPIVS